MGLQPVKDLSVVDVEDIQMWREWLLQLPLSAVLEADVRAMDADSIGARPAVYDVTVGRPLILSLGILGFEPRYEDG